MELIDLNDIERQQIENKYVSFYGAFAQQNPHAFYAINKLLNGYKFDIILEAGTHSAGLSIFFALYCYLSKRPVACDNIFEPCQVANQTHHKSPKEFYTFDNIVRDKVMANLVVGLGAKFGVVDILNNKEAIDSIRNIISEKDKRVLLICDNGDKIKEFELYAPFLKSGDFVLIHDWAKDEEEHKRLVENKIWDGWESKMSDIEEVCKNNNLVQVYRDVFDDVAFGCFIKEQ